MEGRDICFSSIVGRGAAIDQKAVIAGAKIDQKAFSSRRSLLPVEEYKLIQTFAVII